MATPERGAGRRSPLRPEVLAQISRLEIRARRIVEGMVTGRHRSPYKGTSIEFAQHREYVPGDDLKHLDWKVYGRSDRYYVKEYEEETNLRSYLLLDSSESMRYATEPEESKYEYAAAALASIAFMLLRQQDSVGFGAFDSSIRATLPPSAHPQTLTAMLELVATTEPQERTDLSVIFNALALEWRRRGIVVVASDLLEDPEVVIRGLAHLRHAGHEVVVFHVLDRAERELPFEGNTLFRGLESLGELTVDPRALRRGYLDALGRHLDRLREGCAAERIEYVPMTVGEPLGGTLAAFLARRAALRSRGRS